LFRFDYFQVGQQVLGFIAQDARELERVAVLADSAKSGPILEDAKRNSLAGQHSLKSGVPGATNL
jgi:hypothetical protein